MKLVPMVGKYGDGKSIIVDDKDYENVSKQRWYLYKCHKSKNYYLPTCVINKKSISIGQFLLGKKEKRVVDHIDRNTLNNVRSNLRHATYKESSKNRNEFENVKKRKPKLVRTGKGYTKNKDGWQSQANMFGVTYYLGTYKTKKEAHQKFLDFYEDEQFRKEVISKRSKKVVSVKLKAKHILGGLFSSVEIEKAGITEQKYSEKREYLELELEQLLKEYRKRVVLELKRRKSK